MKCRYAKKQEHICSECHNSIFYYTECCKSVTGPTTNEEWLKSLNTDEFADFLEGVAFDSNFRNGIEAEYRREDKDYCYGDRPKIIKAWLKEVHKE